MNAHSEKAAQPKRFAEAAKAVGADEDEAAFKAKLEKIARQAQAPEPPKAAPKPQKPAKE